MKSLRRHSTWGLRIKELALRRYDQGRAGLSVPPWRMADQNIGGACIMHDA
jgi:hypothetical protein